MMMALKRVNYRSQVSGSGLMDNVFTYNKCISYWQLKYYNFIDSHSEFQTYSKQNNDTLKDTIRSSLFHNTKAVCTKTYIFCQY